MALKEELHQFSTESYIEAVHERTFAAKCECAVQFVHEIWGKEMAKKPWKSTIPYFSSTVRSRTTFPGKE